MNMFDALATLNNLSASQRGVFTAAQARTLGVDKLSLSRLVSRGQIERLSHGVYRSCAAPSFKEEDVWAAWLALYPEIPAWQRRRDGSQGAASHATAAWLLGIGELNPHPLTFTLPERKQTRRTNVRLLKAPLARNEVTMVGSIPTTSPSRTVLDLLRDGGDLSLIMRVFADATEAYPGMDNPAFIDEVDKLGKRYGMKGGQSLYERLGETR